MKQITILFLYFLICKGNIASAQSYNPPLPGEYLVNNTLDRFIGTWMWINGNDTVKLFLKKERIAAPGTLNFDYDAIIGWHLYKQGAVIVESSFNYINTPYTDKHSTILGGNGRYGELGDTLKSFIRDVSKNKSISAKLIINTSRTQIQWESSTSPGLHINENQGFTLPNSMILNKQ